MLGIAGVGRADLAIRSKTTCSASPVPSKASDELRVALTDPALPLERRLAVVDQLTEGKILPLSIALIGMVIAAGQSQRLLGHRRPVRGTVGGEREHEVAEVRSAIELDDAQIERLAAAFGRGPRGRPSR